MFSKITKDQMTVAAVLLAIAAGTLGVLYNRDENLIKAVKKANPQANTTGFTEGQVKQWNSYKV